jgi:hypothetical protein
MGWTIADRSLAELMLRSGFLRGLFLAMFCHGELARIAKPPDRFYLMNFTDGTSGSALVGLVAPSSPRVLRERVGSWCAPPARLQMRRAHRCSSRLRWAHW